MDFTENNLLSKFKDLTNNYKYTEDKEEPEQTENKTVVAKKKQRKDAVVARQELTIQTLRKDNKHLKRRIKSELNLNDALEWHSEKGASYHCISFGDVDSLSYLRFLVKQQKIEYLLLSTWCMAVADIVEIEDWLKRGFLKRVDFYVGEIFTGTYSGEYGLICNLCNKYGGRVCVFRNHSKVMAGFGERFDFVIESSANINTNPRCENTVITIDTELALFYKNFFDKVKSFERNYDDWQPYNINRGGGV